MPSHEHTGRLPLAERKNRKVNWVEGTARPEEGGCRASIAFKGLNITDETAVHQTRIIRAASAGPGTPSLGSRPHPFLSTSTLRALEGQVLPTSSSLLSTTPQRHHGASSDTCSLCRHEACGILCLCVQPAGLEDHHHYHPDCRFPQCQRHR